MTTPEANPFTRPAKIKKQRLGRDGKPLKSLRQHGFDPSGGPDLHVVAGRPYDPVEDRDTQLAIWKAHLQVSTSGRGRPFSDGTISAYTEAPKSFNQYLASIAFHGGFEKVTHEELNAYLRLYYEANGLGGTSTKLSNLRAFFKYLAEEYDIENAYQHPRRNSYTRGKEAPALLPDEFVSDLLKTTSGRTFADLRDNLIIRLFMVGPRNCEMAALNTTDLNLREGKVRWPPKKWADDPRYSPMPVETRQVAVKYLQARAGHKSRPGRDGPLFLAQLRSGRMSNSGIAQMLKRRAEQAGYDPDEIHPHSFRHTAADKYLAAGGQEGDLMQLMGWEDGSRSMLDRYGKAGRAKRALDNAQRLGFGEAPK